MRIFLVRRDKAKSIIIWNIDFDSLSFTPAISESTETQIKQLKNKTKTTNTPKVDVESAIIDFLSELYV